MGSVRYITCDKLPSKVCFTPNDSYALANRNARVVNKTMRFNKQTRLYFTGLSTQRLLDTSSLWYRIKPTFHQTHIHNDAKHTLVESSYQAESTKVVMEPVSQIGNALVLCRRNSRLVTSWRTWRRLSRAVHTL
jgi:hypothetical protein